MLFHVLLQSLEIERRESARMNEFLRKEICTVFFFFFFDDVCTPIDYTRIGGCFVF